MGAELGPSAPEQLQRERERERETEKLNSHTYTHTRSREYSGIPVELMAAGTGEGREVTGPDSGGIGYIMGGYTDITGDATIIP